jgi:hypothetical protein
MYLFDTDRVALRAVVISRDVSEAVATRAWIVLWMAEGRRRVETRRWLGLFAHCGQMVDR